MPIATLTTHTFDQMKHECLATDINAHLSKPFSTQQLSQLLQRFSLIPDTAGDTSTEKNE